MVTFAAGGLLRRDDGALCVVHRPRYDDWSLPKGKLEAGETLVETAVREVREETRCTVDCGRYAGRYQYVAGEQGPKGVFVWHMRVVDEPTADEPAVEPEDEVDELVWLAPEDAIDRLTYENERALVARAVVD